MSRKQPGEPAYLYVDMVSSVEVGDFIRTPTGRTYLVTAVRVQERGKWAGRQHLNTVVQENGCPIPDGDVVHHIEWYRR